MISEENGLGGEVKRKRSANGGAAEAQDSGGRLEKKRKSEIERQLKPLRKAAKQIAKMLCEFSCDRELFFSDSASERRLDTKTLKEFSAVLKEISAVMSELNGTKSADFGGVRIEFSSDALDMGV